MATADAPGGDRAARGPGGAVVDRRRLGARPLPWTPDASTRRYGRARPAPRPARGAGGAGRLGSACGRSARHTAPLAARRMAEPADPRHLVPARARRALGAATDVRRNRRGALALPARAIDRR